MSEILKICDRALRRGLKSHSSLLSLDMHKNAMHGLDLPRLAKRNNHNFSAFLRHRHLTPYRHLAPPGLPVTPSVQDLEHDGGSAAVPPPELAEHRAVLSLLRAAEVVAAKSDEELLESVAWWILVVRG